MMSSPIRPLTDLQRKAILSLAVNGPMSGYDFHLGGKRERAGRRALMSKKYWSDTSRNLMVRGLIERANPKGSRFEDERGRRRDVYRLTNKGVLQAIVMDAPLGRLEDWLKRGQTPNEVGLTLIEFAREAGRDFLSAAFLITEREMGDVVKSLLDPDKFSKFVTVLRRKPEYLQAFRDAQPTLAESIARFASGYQANA